MNKWKENEMSLEIEYEALLLKLKERFTENMNRHPDLTWQQVEAILSTAPEKLESLMKMEESGGQPDVLVYGDKLFYVDCSKESPKDRRSLCYDRQARLKRKKNPPKSSVEEMTEEMGVKLLTEDMYRHFQELGAFDVKTSSWVHTPDSIRELGGAIFCDRRYDTVFTYHNGADSYYSARAFRACLPL